MTIIKNVSDLRVYQTSLKLLEKIYDLVYKVPHLRLRTQIIGSSEAVSPLITEGFARKQNPKEAVRFYSALQEYPAIYGGDELKQRRHSPLEVKPRTLVRGECHTMAMAESDETISHFLNE